MTVFTCETQQVFKQYSKKFQSDKLDAFGNRYSGVTKALLKNVTTRLSDVQHALQNIFTPSSILCGQSLNGDLHSLQVGAEDTQIWAERLFDGWKTKTDILWQDEYGNPVI